ncbi:MAG TPA: MBG domain-containing protein [Bacteroidales bacterium]|nr:MBG domain-containing protein [Bacteroidales bacterium]
MKHSFITLLMILLSFSSIIKAADYVVSGAGSSYINGTYILGDQTFNGYPCYVRTEDIGYPYPRCICFQTMSKSSGQWAIAQMEDDGTGNFSVYTIYYLTDGQGSVPPATGWTKTNITASPGPIVQPELDAITYSSTVFTESPSDDGTISNSVTITCDNVSGETFTGYDGEDFVLSGKVAVSNLPAGLTARIIRKDKLTLLATLTGAATSNKNENDITNLKFIFGNSAFSLNSASNIANACKTNISIDFIQVYNVGSSGDFTKITDALAACEDGDVINLAAQTFTESGLELSKNITIQGQGAKSTIIQAANMPPNATDRVFYTDYFTKVKITGVTIRNGNSNIGGGILAGGESLVLQNVSIEDNTGGGIHLTKGSLSITNSTICRNTGGSYITGGLYLGLSTTTTIVNSTITYNSGTGAGGIYCYGGKIDIENSTVSYNQGIGITAVDETITVSNSIFGPNNSYDYNVTNSITLNDNGYNIVKNQHTTNSSGDWRFSESTDILYNYTASGTASNQWTRNNVPLPNQNENLNNIPADNGTLNGTQTLSLLAGSFAIDAGMTTFFAMTDQRGFVRNSTIDIGAYEYGGTTASKPTVNTTAITAYTSSSATLGGNVTSDGGTAVTDRGIVYNMTGNPSVSDTKIQMEMGSGTFSMLVPGLNFGTKYYARAYAINAIGVSYGSELSFTTSLIPPSFTTTPSTTAPYGTRYSYSPGTTTPGGQAATLTAPTLPAWLTLSTSLPSTAESFGNISSGVNISATAGDDDGNTYAITHDGTTIYKITADGTTTTWKSGLRSGMVSGLLYADGYLYIPRYHDTFHCITSVSLTDVTAPEKEIFGFTDNLGSIAYKNGYIYASDVSIGTIYKLDVSTRVGSVFLSPSDGLPVTGLSGFTFGSDGNMYIASSVNNSILMYNGTVVSTIMTGLPDIPTSIQQDLYGNFYISVGNNGVRKYDRNFISYQVVSAGSADYVASLSINTAGELSYSIFNTNSVYRLQTCPVLKGTPAKSDIGNHTVVIRASNAAGNTDQTFTINVVDKTPPVITGLSPADNAVNVAAKPSISISFDEAVSLGSTGTFNLYNGATLIKSFDLSKPADLSAINLSADKLTLSLTLTENIGYGIQVSIDISPGFVKDIYGNNFAGITAASGKWNFTTARDTQTINFPSITSKTYGDASFTLGDAVTDKGLTITYTAADPSVVSISGNQATVLKAGTTTVTASQAGNSTYSAATDVIQTLVVNKKSLTVKADSKIKVYGDANPSLTITYSGWINSDNETVLDTKPTATTAINQSTAAGSYKNQITVSGGSDNNYSFIYQSADFEISKAVLTVTADAKNKTYGDDNPTFTYTCTGWKNSDTESALTTKPTGSTTVTKSSPAGSYPGAITLSGGAATSYSFNYKAADFKVNKAILKVIADAKTRFYGDDNPALTISYSGFKNSESESVLTTKPTISTTITVTSLPGTYIGAITVKDGSAANYTLTYTPGNFTVNKAVITVTADSKTKVYGDDNPELTFIYSGWKNSENESVILIAPKISTSVTTNSNAGTHSGAITVSGAYASNYSFNYVAADFVITKAVLTVTAYPKTRSYGDPDPTLTCEYSGWKNNEWSTSLTTVPTGTTSTTASSPVGTYQNAIIFSDGQAVNYSFNYVAADLTITKAKLNIAADYKTKIYGDPNPELTIRYIGFKNSENESVLETKPVISTTITTTTSAGYYQNAITVSGAAAKNYSISYFSNYFNITKATLTVTADPKTKVYGDANPELTCKYSGWKNSDNLSSLTYVPPVYTSVNQFSPAGKYTKAIIIEEGYGTDNNYDFSCIPADFTITPAPLTITANAQSKTYGDANPTLTYYYSGFKNYENENSLTTKPTISTSVTAATDAGTYEGSITGSGAASSNYTISYVAGVFSVTKAVLKVTPTTQTKVYGDPNPDLTCTYTGWKNNDDESALDIKPLISTTVTILSGARAYLNSISASGGSDNNYTFDCTATGNFTVTRAPLTVTADLKTKVYGDANPTLTWTYSGFKNSDTPAVLSYQPSASTTVTTSSAAGTYSNAITVTVLVFDKNYKVTAVPADFIVYQAELTVTADQQTKEYGTTNPSLTFKYSGFKNSDTESVLSTKPVAGTTVTTATPVGTQKGAITVSGSAAANYDLSYVAADFTITKATLTVTADAKTKEYGEANPDLTFQYSGWKNSDTESVLSTKPIAGTTVTATTAAGTQKDAITVSGGAATNYDLSYVAADFTITKATLTITANDLTKVYGDANPALTFSYSGWKNSDDETVLDTKPSAVTTVTASTPAGTYPAAITVSGGAATNYDLSYVAADFTITKATLTVTADAKTKEYGEANPDLTYSCSGFKNSDTETVLTAKPVAETTVTATTPAGTQKGAITVSGGSATNYDLSYVAADFMITKATLTVTADNQTKVYGEPVPTLTFQYSGWKNSDSESVIDTNPSPVTIVDAATPAGSYSDAINLSGGDDNNYEFSYTAGDFTVTKATLTVTAEAKTKVYGESDPVLAYNISSGTLVGSDKLTGTPDRQAGEDVGKYEIGTGTLTAGNNYDLTFIGDNLTITPLPVSVTADNITKVYGSDDPVLTFSSVPENGSMLSDGLEVSFSGELSRDKGETVSDGPYSINMGSLNNSNYEITFTGGEFSITSAEIMIKADSKTKVYGDTDPEFSFKITSGELVSGDTFSGKLERETGENIGNYAIKIGSVALNDNYKLTYESDNLLITPLVVKVIADSLTKEYKASDPLLTYTSVPESGYILPNGEAISFTGDLARVPGEDIGQYSIEQNTLGNTNYTIDYTSAVLTILLETGINQIIPEKISVNAYPNPFTDRVVFDLQIPSEANVRLEIYDIAGIKRATIVNKKLEPSQTYSIEYVPDFYSSKMLIYRLIINNKISITGKLVHK